MSPLNGAGGGDNRMRGEWGRGGVGGRRGGETSGRLTWIDVLFIARYHGVGLTQRD